MKRKWIVVLAAVLLLSAFGCAARESAPAASPTGAPAETPEAPPEASAPALDADAAISVTDGGYPLTVRDFMDVETRLETEPLRVAVLSGTPLNIWYDLGGKSVCTSQVSDNIRLTQGYEDEIRALPSVGQVYAVNVEAVVEQEPDLIIAQSGVQTTVAAALSDIGFKVIQTQVRSFDDVLDTYRAFGKLLGVSDLAEQKIAEFTQKRDALVSKLPDRQLSVVILYVTSRSIAVKLDNSIAGDIAGMLGLRNIASDLPPDTIGSETTPLDIEYIVEQNPDYVFVTTMVSSNEEAKRTVEEQFSSNPAWSAISAISEGRVIYLPQQYYLYNAGPYYADAIEYMAKSVYPDVYGELD